MATNKLLNRRIFLGALFSTAIATGPVSAASNAQAEALVSKLVGEINTIISSGNSETAMISDFESVFNRYADVPTIARYALGTEARSANSGQMDRFTNEFAGYMARKYGKQFRKFVGGAIEVNGSRPVKQYFEITTTARLKGQAPFEVSFLVSDKSGSLLFFNMYIEGINLLLSERTEIGAILDKNRGNIDAMIEDLAKAG
jgi:phospholipid transport system substrate-binding protein